MWHDLAYSCRIIVKNFRFTVIAVATLALGIGAATAIFVIFDAALTRPLPVPAPSSRGESLKTLITRAVAAEVGQEPNAMARGRMMLPLFGNPKGRRVDVRAEDIARAMADEDVVLSAGHRRR